MVGNGYAQEADSSAMDAGMLAGIEGFLAMALGWAVDKFGIAGTVVSALASLIVAGTAYIYASPSKSDDAMLQKLEKKPLVGVILRVLKAFSLVKRK
jgi:hypothetical protein